MKTTLLLIFFWGFSWALPVAKYLNTDSGSSEELRDHLAPTAVLSLESSESSEESKDSSKEQTNENKKDYSDSTESEEDLSPNDQETVYRLSEISFKSGIKDNDKNDDEDDSGDDTFFDIDNGQGSMERHQREGENTWPGSDDDSDSTLPHGNNAADGEDVSHKSSQSESRSLEELNESHEVRAHDSDSGEDTVEVRSKESYSNSRDDSSLDDEGMQGDDADTIGSRISNSRMIRYNVHSKKKSHETRGQDGNRQDSSDGNQSEGQFGRKSFQRARISKEDDWSENNDSNTMEEATSDSMEKSQSNENSQSHENSKSKSREDSNSQSQEDSPNVQDLSSESRLHDNDDTHEKQSKSQEENEHVSRGDNPASDRKSIGISEVNKEDSSSSSEESNLTTSSKSDSESREDQSDSKSNESLSTSEESRESTEDEDSSSQEGFQSQSSSTESQSISREDSRESSSEQLQGEGNSPSEEEARAFQENSKLKESVSSNESQSVSSEESLSRSIEVESRKLVVDSYHNRPTGDHDDNDCQDGY